MKSKLNKFALIAAAMAAPAAAFAEDPSDVAPMLEKIEAAVTTSSLIATSIVTAMIGLFIYRVASRFIKRGVSSV